MYSDLKVNVDSSSESSPINELRSPIDEIEKPVKKVQPTRDEAEKKRRIKVDKKRINKRMERIAQLRDNIEQLNICIEALNQFFKSRTKKYLEANVPHEDLVANISLITKTIKTIEKNRQETQVKLDHVLSLKN